MLPGPVFNIELLTTARRFRYYAIRFVYGLILLFFIGVTYQSSYWNDRYSRGYRGMSIQEMAKLANDLFLTLVVTQGVTVLLLTPALAAGVVAEEKRRKTLHYLLASRLSSAEIILGKLAARLLHVGVFLAIGLPIVSLIPLFGGVDPKLIVLAFAATATTAFFLASLAILVSTLARRPREAVTLVYLLELAWLFLPSLVVAIGPMPRQDPRFLDRVYEWGRPIFVWLAPSSPIHLFFSGGTGANAIFGPVAWMIGMQTAFGILFAALAIALLRPLLRKEGGGRGWSARLARMQRSVRLLPRPQCGDDAMLWKELHVSRTSLVTKAAILLVAVGAGGLLAWGVYEFAAPAFAELRAYGYGREGRTLARDELNGFLRAVCTLLYIFWGLGLASGAASGITHEREEDTWTSLLATPLTGEEILRAKMAGAVWGVRWIGLLMLLLWLIGLAAGAVHPLGVLAVGLETGVFIWFVTALGTYISLLSKSSARAVTGTIGCLIVLNGGYLMCCIPLRPDTPLIALGVTPFIEAVSLMTYSDVHSFFEPGSHMPPTGEVVLTCVMGTFAYIVAASVLTVLVFSRFDEVVDRPRRVEGMPL